MSAGLKFATFNINSVRTRLGIVLDWLDREKPDLLALQEIKCVDAEFPLEAFEKAGWHAAVKGQKGYNGVALISKKPLKDVVTLLDPKDPDAPARFIAGTCEGVRVFNTYVPQGTDIEKIQYQGKLQFFAQLKDYFKKHLKPGDPALWMGDMNVAQEEIDLARPKANRDHVCFHVDARNALADAVKGTWTDLFREKEKGPGHYTFWSQRFGPKTFQENVGWRVDLIFGTQPMVQRLKSVWIDKEPRKLEKASDHTFVVAEFKG